MLLFYIRHGEPIYNPNTLTPMGERQAEAVAKRLTFYGIDEIYSSTSERAQLTALPTAQIMRKDVRLLDFCNEAYAEKEFGFVDGDRWAWVFQHPRFRKILASKEIAKLGDEWYEYPGFGKYKFKDGVKRINTAVDKFMAELGYEHDREKRIYNAVKPNDKRIALFAHHGFGIYFLSSILDIPYPMFSNHFDIGFTGMTVIDFRTEDGISIPRALTVSNDSHIYREGLPTNYNNEIRF